MSILNFDGPSGRNFGKPLKTVLGIGALAAVVAVASTLAANININSGPVEFGQGVAQTTACDDSIMITPRSSFVNNPNSETSTTRSFPVGASDNDAIIVLPSDGELFYPGMHFTLTIVGDGERIELVATAVSQLLDLVPDTETPTPTNINAPYEFLDGYSHAYEITLDRSIFVFWTLAEATVESNGFQFSGVDVSDIDATEGKCRGKTFTLKAYGETETASLAEYSVYVGETGFSSVNGSIESSNPGTSSSSFSLDFNAPRISASSVYKITIESSDLPQVLLDGRSFNFSQIALLTDSIDENSTPLRAQCSNGVCTAEYIRADFDNGMGPQNPPELLLEKNPSGTSDKKWIFTSFYDGQEPYVTYGYIKYFNGRYGIIQGTEDPTGEIDPADQFQVLFSVGRDIPVDAPGQYSGSVTWSYPSESRYTE